MVNLLTVFGMLPAIIAGIKALEEALPGKGQGEAKLEALRQMLEAVDSAYANYWPQIKGIVAILVKLYNDSGFFKK